MYFRRGFAATLLFILGFGATGSAANLTDTDIHVPPNYFTMQPPAVGGSYVDPVFGTTIKRLTDTTNDPIAGMAVPYYSQTSSFNLDDTYSAPESP